MLVKVRAIPRAGRNQIVLSAAGSLRIYASSAPENGKANEAVAKMLADYFGVPKSSVRLVRGASSRDKVFSIDWFITGKFQSQPFSRGHR
ncbi:MAG: DUF167 domain-containing protein [Rickettsiales bacterium]|jgi:uncharacterized protein YggU (UPF0235/DUF167 family)|nr:DUF167 domain-containing protein [Rickettsiales bacterium]